MSYFLRILGKKDPDIHLDFIYSELQKRGLKANLEITEDNTPASWDLLKVTRGRGMMLSQIERNRKGEPLFDDEIAEFRNEIATCKPENAVPWLNTFFDKVTVIYAFDLLQHAYNDNNLEVIEAIRDIIWNKTDGILQADHEGFTNEDGDHILWQFDDDAEGEWHCAVLDKKGTWNSFAMELDNPEHRKKFLAGKVC